MSDVDHGSMLKFYFGGMLKQKGIYSNVLIRIEANVLKSAH
jgi:hypothetical protein